MRRNRPVGPWLAALAALAVLTVAALWTACSDDIPVSLEELVPVEEEDTVGRHRANAEAFEFGGTLTFATIAEQLTLNLALANDVGSAGVPGYVFEGLTEISWLTGEPQPNLAHTWDVSANGLTRTFYLRRDVRWHDGEPFTVADVNDGTFNEVWGAETDPSEVIGHQFAMPEPLAEDENLVSHRIQWIKYPEQNTERNKEGTGNAIWGGGSFLQAIGALAIEGCNVDAFAAFDATGKNVFGLHHFQAPDFVNTSFGDSDYMTMIPAGSILAFTCVDACDVIIGPGAEQAKGVITPCLSFEEHIKASLLDTLFDFQTGCTDDFTGEVKRNFFNIVPLFQDTCIAYFPKDKRTQPAGVAYNPTQFNFLSSVIYQKHPPFIIVDNRDADITEKNGDYFWHRETILHELCHQQQFWYMEKFYDTYDVAIDGSLVAWEDTLAGKEFIDVIGFIKDKDGKWDIGEDNKYHAGWYLNRQPVEYSAAVCNNYIVEKVYENEYPEIPRVAVSKTILTPETRGWLEKYVVIN